MMSSSTSFISSSVLGAFASAAPLAPMGRVKQFGDLITFDAVYVEPIGEKGMGRVIPVSTLQQPPIQVQLGGEAGSVPVYRFAARDGSVAEIQVGYARAPGETNPKAPHKPQLLDEPFVYTVGASLSVMVTDKLFPAQRFTLVRAVNCRVSKAEQSLFFQVKVLDETPFAAFNALPLERRIAELFGASLTQRRLPPVLDLVAHRDAAERLASKYALPLPMTLLSLNRDYVNLGNGGGSGGYSEMPLVLPEAGLAAEQTRVHKLYMDEHPREFASKKDGENEVYVTSFKYGLVQWQLNPEGTARQSFKIDELRFHSEGVTTAGTIHPLTLNALLSTHPIPALVLAGLDVPKTMAEQKNYSEFRQGYEDGVANLHPKIVAYRLVEYLLTCGIPVSLQGAVKARFGDRMIPYEPADYDKATGEITLGNASKSFKRPALRNPYAPGVDVNLIACDALPFKSGKFPSEEEYVFYALSLSPSVVVPMTECEADAYTLPEGQTVREVYRTCALTTPEEGDAFVLKHKGPAATPAEKKELGDMADHAPWLLPKTSEYQKDKRVPRFLFFAVKRTLVETWNQPLKLDIRRPTPDLIANPALARDLTEYCVRLVADTDAKLNAKSAEGILSAPSSINNNNNKKRPRSDSEGEGEGEGESERKKKGADAADDDNDDVEEEEEDFDENRSPKRARY